MICLEKIMNGDEFIMEEESMEQAMERIASYYRDTFYSPSKAEAKIEITPRIEGKKVIFKTNLVFHHLDRFKDQAEDDEFMERLQFEMEIMIARIKFDVDQWERTHEGAIEFLDFE